MVFEPLLSGRLEDGVEEASEALSEALALPEAALCVFLVVEA